MKNTLIKIIAVLICTIIIFGAVGGCNGSKNRNENGKLKIIATLFPQYDFAKNITGEKADVRLLLPPGTEAHSYEPTPKDIIDIQNADIFIYTGDLMEPWVKELTGSIKKDTVVIIDASKGINLIGLYENDPHIWLDPLKACKMVENILNAVIASDKKDDSLKNDENYYNKNAEEYITKLKELDNDFKNMLTKTTNKIILYGGHFAFGHFAKRYNLEYISPYTGFSPDAEPTPQKIAELIKNIETTGTKYIFIEELVEQRVARIISEQTNAEMLLLHGAHNVSKAELNSGIGYIQIMRGNLERLKTGLGYVE